MTKTTSDNLIERFDAGEDVFDYFDVESPVIEEPDTRNITITVPEWLVRSLDREATRRGIARKAVINTALVEWTDALDRSRPERLTATA